MNLDARCMEDICIRLTDLAKTFPSADSAVDQVRAVKGINLDISRGEIVALLGPNGAGKTTTLDMVLGFIQPTAGTVAVFGGSPKNAIRDGRVSGVLQTGGLLRDITVRETVTLFASTYQNPRSVGSVLEATGLTDVAGQKVQTCSGGEQQRLRFALALLGDPDLLILDEPTAGMDVQARRDFWQAMRDEAAQGRTVVFATHYLQEAEDFARRTVLMAKGRIVADGSTEEVRNRAAQRRVIADFELDRIGEASDHLRSLPHVRSVEIDADRITVDTLDSDQVARLVLGSLEGRNLSIETASLETAFMHLTQTGADL